MTFTTSSSPSSDSQGVRGFSASVPGFSAAIGPDGHVYLSGELDITGLDPLRAVLDQAVLDSHDLLIVDVAGLSFIDSSAIAELLRYQIAAARRQRQLRLVGVPESIAQVLDILDLRPILMEPKAQTTTEQCA